MRKKNGDISLNYAQRAFIDNVEIGDDFLRKNNFIIEFPDDIGLRFYDIVSVAYIDDKTCRFTVRDNSVSLPLFNLNKYKCKYCNIFKKNRDIITINYLDRYNKLVYKSILSGICIKNVLEESLDYSNSNIRTITFDVKYRKRFLEKACNQ